jgi:hypothetical protein
MALGASELPKAPRAFAGATAVVCWCALALQFDLVLAKAAEMGVSGAFAVMVYASFFTVQSDLLAAIVTSLAAVGAGRMPARSRLTSAIAVYVVAGGIIFFLTLRPVWDHHGLQLLADILLHYVTPVLYVAFWLAVVRKQDLRWRDALVWLIYPAAYFAGVLMLGIVSGFYPYPFLDLHALGAAMLAINLAALIGAGLAVGLLAVAVGRAAGAIRIDRGNRAA